jgi:hypothetical protein
MAARNIAHARPARPDLEPLSVPWTIGARSRKERALYLSAVLPATASQRLCYERVGPLHYILTRLDML